MLNVLSSDSQNATPLMLRFLTAIEPAPGAIAYDPVQRVNVLAGQTVPAVCGGFDVKTVGAAAED